MASAPEASVMRPTLTGSAQVRPATGGSVGAAVGASVTTGAFVGAAVGAWVAGAQAARIKDMATNANANVRNTFMGYSSLEF